MIKSPPLHRQISHVCLSIFLVVFAFSSTGCGGRRGDQSSGTAGDYVNGTPLPERREGTSFFGSNVQRGQFRPIYFDFDSQSVRSSETGKIQEIASFMKSNKKSPRRNRRGEMM